MHSIASDIGKSVARSYGRKTTELNRNVIGTANCQFSSIQFPPETSSVK